MSDDRSHASPGSDIMEKNKAEHDENPDVPKSPTGESIDEDNGFEVNAEELPPGYFKSPFFLGTMTGIGLGLMAGVAGYGFAAPILTIINNDIGPDENIVWVALTYTLTSAVMITVIGRVTDIFGRRWVFVGGAALGIIGSIIAATAQDVNTLIGGTTIIGIAAATQLSYYYVMGELVPMEYRLAGNAFCYVFTTPGSGISPVIAQAFVQHHPNVGWRGCYYVLIGVNTASFLCWFFFYHPPTFRMKHGKNASLLKYIKDFDYFGTILYTGSLLILMMGLNWGGTVYAWASASVIATIVTGFVGLLIFVLWESYAKLKEPLVPMHLFKNRCWNAATILSGLGASVYYSLALVWPSMVAVLYNDHGPAASSWYASFVGLFIIVGEVVGGCLAKSIGHLKWQCVVTVLISGIFFGCTATSTPTSMARASAFVAMGTFAIGWTESLAISIVTISVKDQNRLGSASGLAGSIRFFIASIATTVYNVVLNNRLSETVPSMVPPALTEAGLPASSVADFMAALTAGTGFEGIAGITDSIIAAGVQANKEANAAAYRTVFFTSIAFSGIAFISSLFLTNVDDLLTTRVASTLHRGKKDETAVKEGEA